MFVVPLVARAGRPGFPFSASQAGGPSGGLIIGLGVRVESFQAPAARQDVCGGDLAKGSQGSSVGAEASGLQEVGRGAPVCEPQSPDQGS